MDQVDGDDGDGEGDDGFTEDIPPFHLARRSSVCRADDAMGASLLLLLPKLINFSRQPSSDFRSPVRPLELKHR